MLRNIQKVYYINIIQLITLYTNIYLFLSLFSQKLSLHLLSPLLQHITHIITPHCYLLSYTSLQHLTVHHLQQVQLISLQKIEDIVNHIQEITEQNISLKYIKQTKGQYLYAFQVNFQQINYEICVSFKYLKKLIEAAQTIALVPIIPDITVSNLSQQRTQILYTLLAIQNNKKYFATYVKFIQKQCKLFFQNFFQNNEIQLSFLPRNFLISQDIEELNQFLQAKIKQNVENVTKQSIKGVKTGVSLLGRKIGGLVGSLVSVGGNSNAGSSNNQDEQGVNINMQPYNMENNEGKKDNDKEFQISHKAEEQSEQGQQHDTDEFNCDIQKIKLYEQQQIEQVKEMIDNLSGQFPIVNFKQNSINNQSIIQEDFKQLINIQQQFDSITEYVNIEVLQMLIVYLDLLNQIQMRIKKYYQEYEDLQQQNKKLAEIQVQISNCNKQKSQLYNQLIVQMNQQICIVEQQKVKIQSFQSIIKDNKQFSDQFYQKYVQNYIQDLFQLINKINDKNQVKEDKNEEIVEQK